jgi:hypothetical protein
MLVPHAIPALGTIRTKTRFDVLVPAVGIVIILVL